MIPLTLEMVDQAARMCAAAFADDPSMVYHFPDPSKRGNLHYAFRYYLKLDVLSGAKIYVTSPACEAIASWIPSDVRVAFWHYLRAGLIALPFRVGWEHIKYEQEEEAFASRMRKKYVPRRYMYLGLLAVSPEFQGKGFASCLIKPMLSYLDEHNLTCYLETQTRRNVGMYTRYGFELKETAVFPPGSNCELHAMLRIPSDKK